MTSPDSVNNKEAGSELDAMFNSGEIDINMGDEDFRASDLPAPIQAMLLQPQSSRIGNNDVTSPPNYDANTVQEVSLIPERIRSVAVNSISKVGIPVGAMQMVRGEEASRTVAEYAATSTTHYQVGTIKQEGTKAEYFMPLEVINTAYFTQLGSLVYVRVHRSELKEFTLAKVVQIDGTNVGVSIANGPVKIIPVDILRSMNSYVPIDVEYVETHFPIGTPVKIQTLKGIIEGLTVKSITEAGIKLEDSMGNNCLILAHNLSTFLTLNSDLIKSNTELSVRKDLPDKQSLSIRVCRNSTPELVVSGSEGDSIYLASARKDNSNWRSLSEKFFPDNVRTRTLTEDIVDVLKNAMFQIKELQDVSYCSVHFSVDPFDQKSVILVNYGGYRTVVIDSSTSRIRPLDVTVRDDGFIEISPGIGKVDVSSRDLICVFSPDVAPYFTNDVIQNICAISEGKEDRMYELIDNYIRSKLYTEAIEKGKPELAETSFSFVLRRP